MKRPILIVLFCLLLVSLAACEIGNKTTTSPTDPLPVLITVVGNCVAVGSTAIQCTDSSSSQPPQQLLNVVWEFTNTTTGVFAGSETGNIGDIVQKTGLPAGLYSIRQVVRDIHGGTQNLQHNVTLA